MKSIALVFGSKTAVRAEDYPDGPIAAVSTAIKSNPMADIWIFVDGFTEKAFGPKGLEAFENPEILKIVTHKATDRSYDRVRNVRRVTFDDTRKVLTSTHFALNWILATGHDDVQIVGMTERNALRYMVGFVIDHPEIRFTIRQSLP